MTYIHIENLTKTILDRTIIDKASFGINPGEKIALVAKNGTGKSTLLKILTGNDTFYDGKLTIQKDIKVGFLEQEPVLNLDHTLSEEIFNSNSSVVLAVKEYEDSLNFPDDSARMQRAFDEMNKYNAWEYEAQIHEILKMLKLEGLKGKISTFSGGQRKRLALAKVLIDDSDFLILDEPTNHLDLEMIDWLEKYLLNKKGTILLVTHDRYFLDKVCTQILELSNEKIYKHKGNYSYYLEKKKLREELDNANIGKAKSFLKKEEVWIKRQPQGRQTKAQARVDSYYDLKSNIGIKHKVNKVELDVIENRLGGKILEIFNLTKSFGNKKILDKFSYSFKRGEKIGIIGKNGVGKTTFLNVLMGLEPVDDGNIVTGETVKFGYYSQHQQDLKENERVLDFVKSFASNIKLSNGSELSASQMLERFLFTKNDQKNVISNLSGGEKKRLSLLTILMKSPNFLILDEPTNDFDLMTLEVLEEFLVNFKGCLIVISHDRYFMDQVVDQLFVFKGDGQIRVFPGSYSEYRASLKNVEKDDSVPQTEVTVKHIDKSEANELYREIAKLEKKKERLNQKMFELGDKYDEIAKIANQVQELDDEINQKNDMWLELTTN